MEKEKVMPLTDNNFTEKLAEAITPASWVRAYSKQFCLNIDGETVVFKPVQQADGSFLLIGKKDA